MKTVQFCFFNILEGDLLRILSNERRRRRKTTSRLAGAVKTLKLCQVASHH
jgi:hypothetical protein